MLLSSPTTFQVIGANVRLADKGDGAAEVFKRSLVWKNKKETMNRPARMVRPDLVARRSAGRRSISMVVTFLILKAGCRVSTGFYFEGVEKKVPRNV